MSPACDRRKGAFTLVELAVVVVLLAIVATLALRRLEGVRARASRTAAAHDMRLIRDAIMGDAVTQGYIGDMAPVPGFSPGWLRMSDILTPTNLHAWGMAHTAAPALRGWDDAASRGWRGPYVRIDRSGPSGVALFPAPGDRRDAHSPTFAECQFFPDVAKLAVPADWKTSPFCQPYGTPREPALYDPWGSPYVLQIPPPQAFADTSGALLPVPDEERFHYARIVSAGPNGILDTPCYHSNTNASGSSWSESARRASIFAGHPEDRGDDLVLFLDRADIFDAY